MFPWLTKREGPVKAGICEGVGLIIREISFQDFHLFGLRKAIFSARLRFGRSRSSKVIDFGNNRKRVCDFLLVRLVSLVVSRTVS